MASPEQTQTRTCYRHPGRETAVSCSNCGRPICPDCMVYAAVGIKCPECAGQPTGPRAATQRVGRAASVGTGALVTKALIAINVVVYLISIAQGSGGLQPAQSFIERWALNGFAVSEGEWYRLITSAFLHASLIHLAFNMLMLWWFGQALEAAVGRARFLGIYLVSALAGSAGALLLSGEFVNTVGASGAVFGILGAGLVLERRQIYVFGGGALFVVILNVVFTFAVSNISIGGHLGGLVGGILSMLALTAAGRHPVYGRLDLVSILALVGLGAASVLVAYLRVRGYPT
ncbi:MAG TPA: rhomboid family intramembrane serine protease [Gaiellaceae bacterium]|nr:rhomboid family intramembrane serine protease [Gaiellaceae bacterium]